MFSVLTILNASYIILVVNSTGLYNPITYKQSEGVVMIRIQFDITEEELQRMLPFILKEKNRHVFAEKALSQWINREEGRIRRVKK